MTILPALTSQHIACDICIVGTGPAGLALAFDCERLGLKVLALEAGNRQPVSIPKSEADILSPEHHGPLHITTRSAFGGTSWGWAGLCTRFDDIDFAIRSHVQDSGWPIGHTELAPYYARAGSFLNCHVDREILVDDIWHALEGVTLDSEAYASAQPRLGESHWDHCAKSKNIMVCLNTAVVGLNLGADGRHIEAIAIVSHGLNMTLRPPRVVLACGGLRTAQLLLATQRRWPNHFGGTAGVLGRNYMGHLTGWISSIRFNNLTDAAYFKPIAAEGAKFAQRRFTISRQLQLSEGLQNIALWAGARAFYDPTHTNGLLSAAYLALALPGIGPLLLPKPLRRAALGPKPRSYMPHVQNVARAPLQTALGAIRAVCGKMRAQQAIGELLQHDGSLEYLLTYHAEAAPSRESRVTLGEKTDSFGLPRMRIDLRFSDTDIASVVRAHEILDRALRKAGKARLEYLDAPEGRASRVLEQATDGYHQLGLTRMGTDPGQSIVDQNCRVHGLENLFIASGSVFPTSGRANPTLLTVALAFRLADHVAMVMRGEVTPS